jgi:hypothetical protein
MCQQEDSNGIKNALRVNAIVETIVIIIALAGNFLIITLFGRKRYRTKPSHVFVIFSSLVDNLFLILHLFEVKFTILFFI